MEKLWLRLHGVLSCRLLLHNPLCLKKKKKRTLILLKCYFYNIILISVLTTTTNGPLIQPHFFFSHADLNCFILVRVTVDSESVLRNPGSEAGIHAEVGRKPVCCRTPHFFIPRRIEVDTSKENPMRTQTKLKLQTQTPHWRTITQAQDWTDESHHAFIPRHLSL